MPPRPLVLMAIVFQIAQAFTSTALAALTIEEVYALARQAGSGDRDSVAKLTKEAEDGNVTAQFLMGNLHDGRFALPHDDQERRRWYRLASDQGHAMSQFYLGLLNVNGVGGQTDTEEGIRLIRMAAEQGNTLAQRELARMFDVGRGVDRDVLPRSERCALLVLGWGSRWKWNEWIRNS